MLATSGLAGGVVVEVGPPEQHNDELLVWPEQNSQWCGLEELGMDDLQADTKAIVQARVREISIDGDERTH